MKIPKSLYNWISLLGIIISINCALLIVALFIISLSSETSSAYLGLYIYIILPTLLVLGLIMVLIGMLIKRREKHDDEGSSRRWPLVDLNNPRQRRSLSIVSVSALVFLVVSAMGSYQAFQYSESVSFCGKLCHEVMKPEYITYLHSPHARVRCVDCHVGEGADWYVKSKLSGLYQLYAVTFNVFPRPIPTPVKNLRPARETCEKCHWPQKFYPQSLRNQKNFITDSANTEWNFSMVMKTGPAFSALALKEGIHWHINPDVKIEYISNSKDRESIPWVRYTNKKTGEVQIFQDTENSLTQKAMDSLETRTMDCMDCHNRPSHSYKSPVNYIDNALTAGTIPAELPYIKKIAMKVLKLQFNKTDSAIAFIRDTINRWYQTKHPDIYNMQKPLIDKAINGIVDEFQKNTFPEMKVTYASYLNHIGHMESNGCFRCHSDKHKSQTGKVISKDCNLCHSILAEGPVNNMKIGNATAPLEFQHPIDIGNDWKEYFCSECHRVLYP
jgi:nitrate/TMAO reductase-like tetraheme cytochrome c subunit